MTRAIGKVVEAPGFELYRGDSYSDESLAERDRITREYRSSPLEQPGQVGYLDFLYRKYKSKVFRLLVSFLILCWKTPQNGPEFE